MRPAGEIRQALIQAAHALAHSGRGATLAELADKACVGRDAARMHVPKLKSRGHLQIVCERKVDYRNRPVAEYAPAKVLSLQDVQAMTGAAVLSNCMRNWAR
jgi:hypothetical protein